MRRSFYRDGKVGFCLDTNYYISDCVQISTSFTKILADVRFPSTTLHILHDPSENENAPNSRGEVTRHKIFRKCNAQQYDMTQTDQDISQSI